MAQTPIVFVPGLLCSAEIFGPQIAALWPYSPVTVASTLEGGTIAEIASSILAAAPPSFALIGLSMGGYISLEIMRQAPERAKQLALLDTSARPDTPAQTELRRSSIAQAKAGNFEAVLDQALKVGLRPAVWNNPELRQLYRRMGMTIGAESFARHQEAIIARVDSRPSLSKITVPTLVLVGDSDVLTPPDRAKEIAEAIPGARLVEVPECGHGSTLDQPEAVTRALVEWLNGG
jgi:pimeloyl-ACP methyl ester carboxylesterase